METANDNRALRTSFSKREIALGSFALAALAVAILFAVLLSTTSANLSSAASKAQSRESKLASQVDSANRKIDECHDITAAIADSLSSLSHANDVFNAAILTGTTSGLGEVKVDQDAALASLQSVKVKNCR